MTAPGLPRLLDALDEAVVAVENGVVAGLNRAAAELLRVAPERALGRPAIEVLRHHRLEAAALGGGEVEVEVGGRQVRARGVPGGLVLRDVTDERRRERELREVMAVLGHEFRTPVAAIKSLVEALECDPPEEQRRRFLAIAAEETDRLVRLVEDLTVGFRPQAERTFPVADAARRALGLLSGELAARDVRPRVSGEGSLVRCDPDKLVQVLLNLLENAARHGPAGGVVRLEATRRNSEVSVTVRDEGAALPDYDFLFEAHRRGESAGPGSGMGLYIVRTIVTGWGGRVWARHTEGPEGSGNEFGFTVPAGA